MFLQVSICPQGGGGVSQHALQPGGVSQHALQPGGDVQVQAQGGVQVHAWGVSRPRPRGIQAQAWWGLGPDPGVYFNMH